MHSHRRLLCARIALLALGTLLLGFVPAAAQASLVIDTFDATTKGWPLQLTTPGATGILDQPLPSVAGGVRTVYLNLQTVDVPGLDRATAHVFTTGGFSLIDYASTSGATGGLSLRYDGGSAGMALDLSSQVGLAISLLSFDSPDGSPMPISVQMISDYLGPNHRVVTLPATVTAAGPQTVTVRFDAVPSSVDFSNINYIDISFEAPMAADFRVDEIRAEVPEPATLGLMALGLSAVFVRRKRTASAGL